MITRSALVTLATVSMLSATACRHRVEPEPTVQAGTTTTTTTTSTASASELERRRADSVAAARANDAARAQRRADSLAALDAARSADVKRTQAELSDALAQRIYFDYDKDALRDDAIATLDAKVAILMANPALTVMITGHTDERGTAEYNLALGQRRAAQVKRYLVGKGIGDARLGTQSLGDSQPAATGSDEASYQQNRRAEFESRKPGGALVRPTP